MNYSDEYRISDLPIPPFRGDGNKIARCTVINVTNSIVTFKDPNLEKAIRYTLNKLSGDIFRSDVHKITQLDASKRDNSVIIDISGIENLTNLEKLNLDCNSISDISALKELTNLTNLWLGGNLTNDISALKELINLTYLNLSHNYIDDTDIQELRKFLPNLFCIDFFQ